MRVGDVVLYHWGTTEGATASAPAIVTGIGETAGEPVNLHAFFDNGSTGSRPSVPRGPLPADEETGTQPCYWTPLGDRIG